MVEAKAFSYMMDTLRRIVSRVEEISADWWWFELGKIPVVRVRRLYVEDEPRLEYMPKLPVVDALKIIYDNFERLRDLGRVSSERRVDIGLAIAHDLYRVLLAVTYIIEAHRIAEKLHELQGIVSKNQPDQADKISDLIRPIIGRLREILATNYASWPNIKKEVEENVRSLFQKFGTPLRIPKTERVTEERVVGEHA